MTYVWAHRGASGYAPENTLEAFALADKMKADGIELDVHLSKDGEIIVTHDENVQRVTCGVDAMVKDLTLAELKKLDVYNGIEGYRNVRIPTLPEVLDFLKTNNLYLNIELKTGIVLYDGIEQKTIDAVRAAGLQDRVIYSSFNHYSLLKVRRLDPNAVCGLLYDAMLYQPWDYARQLGVQALHPHFSEPTFVTGEVEAAHRLGLSVNVWTVNEEADLRRMAEMGCDGIISNYPDVALRVLREVRG